VTLRCDGALPDVLLAGRVPIRLRTISDQKLTPLAFEAGGGRGDGSSVRTAGGRSRAKGEAMSE